MQLLEKNMLRDRRPYASVV